MQTQDTEILVAIAREAERLFVKIGAQYKDEEAAPDAVADFIIACLDAAEAEPEPKEPVPSSVSVAAVKERKRQLRNKRKAQRQARKANR